MAKKIDPKAKAKKQKIYAAIGGVLLLGLLAVQVPRTMKMRHPPNPDDPAASSPAPTTTTSGPIAAPSLSGGNATAVSSSGAGGGLADPDTVPIPQSGQLLAFGLFRTKDPFAQQLDQNCVASSNPTGGQTGAACPTTTPTATAGTTPTATAGTTPAKTPPAEPSHGVPTGTPPPAAALLTNAVILVNGESQTVPVGSEFPTVDPVFTLVSVTATTAKVGIAGGSFESGSQTVTLKKNKPLTLMNTADGLRYVLRLVSIS
jgi:hypothetical protein